MESDIKGLMNKYEYGLEMLQVQLNVLIKEYTKTHNYNPIEHVKTRIKSIDSIINKLNKKGYELTPNNIYEYVYDVVGVRIICSFISDVYEIVNLIKNFKQLTIIKEKDYIENPKESGYTSYHLIVSIPVYLNNRTEFVKAEIQIRTMAMDFWASLDHKIQYKFPNDIPEEVKNAMYNYAIDIKNLDHKMLELNKIMNKYKS